MPPHPLVPSAYNTISSYILCVCIVSWYDAPRMENVRHPRPQGVSRRLEPARPACECERDAVCITFPAATRLRHDCACGRGHGESRTQGRT